MGTIEDAVIDYCGRGWSVMLIPAGQKKTTENGWPDENDTLDWVLSGAAGGGVNLAVRLGERSGQLADVDLDTDASRAVAPWLLPLTTATFGRDGVAGMTHYLYLAPDGPPKGQRGTMRLNTAATPGDATVTTYAELRWNGAYTVLPPSTHPEGGEYRWTNSGSPPPVPWSTLAEATREVAAAALLVEAYPELKRLRHRHYTSLALSAALLRAGWPLPRVERFVYACAQAAGDEEADARVDNARSTAERLAAGEHLGGWSALVSYLGDGVVTRFQRFLGLDARATSAGTWAGVVSPPAPATGPTAQAPTTPASVPKLSVVQPAPGPSRPQVEVGHSDLLRLCEETWGAVGLMQVGHPDGPQVFRYGSIPVRIARWGRGGTATTTATLLQSLPNGEAIRNALATMLVEFGTMVKGKGGGPDQWVPAYPDGPQSGALYDYLDRSGVPEIELVSGVPLIAPDGSVVTTPGYHAGARMYLEPQLTIPAVPDVPDEATIARCRELWVEEVLGDFPFKGQADRANALSMCLTPYVRPAIQGPIPLYGITAVVQGTGKTRLAQVALETAFGTDYARMLAVGDGEEARKQITATLKDLPRGVLLDNVDKMLDSAPLAKVLTDSHWSDRILGVSTIASFPVLCMWIVTGNNLNYSADLIRRVVPSALDANMERPWQRPASAFKHPELLEWTRAHRADLVWAALVLCRAGLQRLAAQGYQGPTIGSFEHWARILGSVLEAAGVEGFLENLGVLYEQADIDTSQWRDFVSDWHSAHGYSVVNSPKLWTLWSMGDYFDLEGRSDRARQTQLGLLLRKMTGRPLGGKKIAQLDKRAHGYTQWHLLDA